MRIQVATLNVWALPEPFAPDVLPRMEAIGNRFADSPADVIALQEVWSGAARDVLLSKAEAAGYHDHWFLGGAIGRSGLMVVSRLPILEADFEPFNLSGTLEQFDNGEYLSGKGFVRLRLQGSDGPVSFINTHLHARYKRRVAHAFTSHRVGQLVQLAGRIRAIEDPVIMTGDFNFDEAAPEYGVLSGLTGVRDVALEYGDPLPTLMRTNAYRYRPTHVRSERRVDYVFVRDGIATALRPTEVDRIFDETIDLDGHAAAYSNHAGVYAELEAEPVAVSRRHRLSSRAIEMAANLLSDGREQAHRRRADSRTYSGVGMACAALALAGERTQLATRRRFLKRGLQLTAVAAVTPTVGGSLLSEWVLPNELSAFELAERRLDQLARGEEDSDGSAVPS